MSANIELQTDERGGVLVLRDGHPQSYVDPNDPGLLTFEYIQHFALVLDLLPPGPLAVTHVGGAGLTLARYLQHTRAGSPQIVLEPDEQLTAAVRQNLPLPRGHRIRVRPVDGFTGLQCLAEGSADVIVIDAFDNGRVPGDLVTTVALQRCSQVLKPDGVLLFNIADRPDRQFLNRVLAGAAKEFSTLTVLTTSEVLRKKRFGNYVLAATNGTLPDAELRRQVAAADFPTRLVPPGETAAWARSARPISSADEDAAPAPSETSQLRFR
ncbi:spermidine synthase [Yimella sp. cx-51]|uniref:spermidine synthase n=1 Tax=Yimella sp. cx-51 TaxID=2770551 RepID=UPI00165DBBFE|nr:fused MFS/spermidine synthase [Yimella sp. cx-51]MBC9955736.1 fused MFS/spermidine synthase [Yimella sp. cx-51]QTH37699.1 fused MFS/spermidine synthase [Yimella sp. cx-51]